MSPDTTRAINPNRIVEKSEGGVPYDPKFKSEFIEDLKEIIKKHIEEAKSRLAGAEADKKQ